MTRDEVIQIYCQVSDELCGGAEWCWSGVSGPLEKFAALVAAHEQKECAKLSQRLQNPYGDCPTSAHAFDMGIIEYFKAIRARGQG